MEEVEQEEEADEEEQERYIYYILEFPTIEDLFTFVGTVDYPVEESELYKMDGHYYLTVLINVENRSKQYPGYILSRMLEFTNDTKLTRPALQEHGTLMLPLAQSRSLGRFRQYDSFCSKIHNGHYYNHGHISHCDPLVRFMSLRVGAVDNPNARRINKVPMPSAGGLAIFVAFTISVLWFYHNCYPCQLPWHLLALYLAPGPSIQHYRSYGIH